MMKDKTGKWKLEIKRGGERRLKRKSESRSIAGMAASGRPLNWIRVANPRARQQASRRAISGSPLGRYLLFFGKFFFHRNFLYLDSDNL
jgi:hypothetical protein